MTTALWRIATPDDAGAIHTIRRAETFAQIVGLCTLRDLDSAARQVHAGHLIRHLLGRVIGALPGKDLLDPLVKQPGRDGVATVQQLQRFALNGRICLIQGIEWGDIGQGSSVRAARISLKELPDPR